MRTDSVSSDTSKPSSVTPSRKNSSLANQLFSVGQEQSVFDRLLNQQVVTPARDKTGPITAERQDSNRKTDSRQDSGKKLPPRQQTERPSAERTDKSDRPRTQDQQDQEIAEAPPSNPTQAPAAQPDRMETAGRASGDSSQSLDDGSKAAKLVEDVLADESPEGTELTGDQDKHLAANNVVSDAEMTEAELAEVETSDVNASAGQETLETKDADGDETVSGEEIANPEDLTAQLETTADETEFGTTEGEPAAMALDEVAVATTKAESGQTSAIPLSGTQLEENVTSEAGSDVATTAPVDASRRNVSQPGVMSQTVAQAGVQNSPDSQSQTTTDAATNQAVDDALDEVSQSSDKLTDAMDASKPAKKGVTENSTVLTPVQERLAALAKTLDKRAEKSPASDRKAIETVDSTKSAVLQRGVDQFSRVQGNGVKPFTTTMTTPMYQKEWAGEMSQKLMMMVSSKIQSAQILITPKDMGPIDVKVSMQQEQAHVVFTTPVTHTRDALEQALPKLREMLEQNGVSMGDVDVRDQGTQHSSEGHAQDRRSGSGNGTEQSDRVADTAENGADQIQMQPVGLVDYYA